MTLYCTTKNLVCWIRVNFKIHLNYLTQCHETSTSLVGVNIKKTGLVRCKVRILLFGKFGKRTSVLHWQPCKFHFSISWNIKNPFRLIPIQLIRSGLVEFRNKNFLYRVPFIVLCPPSINEQSDDVMLMRHDHELSLLPNYFFKDQYHGRVYYACVLDHFRIGNVVIYDLKYFSIYNYQLVNFNLIVLSECGRTSWPNCHTHPAFSLWFLFEWIRCSL